MGAGPAIAQMLDELRGPQPRRSDRSLNTTPNGAYRTTLDKRSVEQSGCDKENPGKIAHFYYPKHDVILIDLGGEYTNE